MTTKPAIGSGKNLSHKTAKTRKALSGPARYLYESGLLKGKCLDYGCGKGFDCDELGMDGFDPYYRNVNVEEAAYDTVMCIYVLNCLHETEWIEVLHNIRYYMKSGGTAYIAVRNDRSNLNGYTKTGTYQTVVDLIYPIEKVTSKYIIYKMEVSK